MDVNEAANLRNLKTYYDAIVCSISATCSEWSLFPIDVKVVVKEEVFFKLCILIGYPDVYFEKTSIGRGTIGIADTEIIVDSNQHFVQGEMPFKIMKI